jgi:hypothetical protein
LSEILTSSQKTPLHHSLDDTRAKLLIDLVENGLWAVELPKSV